MTCYAVLKSKYNNAILHNSPLYESSKHAAAWVKRKMKKLEDANELWSEIIVVVEE